MKKTLFQNFKIAIIALTLISITTSSCAVFKKDCDCPTFGQKKKPKDL